jgi:hypothetical protein
MIFYRINHANEVYISSKELKTKGKHGKQVHT